MCSDDEGFLRYFNFKSLFFNIFEKMAKWGVIDGSRVTGAFMQTSEDLTHYLLDDKHHCYKLWLRYIAFS